MLEHSVVTFISALDALAKIKGQHRVSIEKDLPLPTEPKLPTSPDEPKDGASADTVAAHKEKLEAWHSEVKRLEDAHKAATEAAARAREERFSEEMAQVTPIVEDEGHPELPENLVVRSRMEGRCRLVGCSDQKRQATKPDPAKAKANRYRTAFCGAHLGLRRQVTRRSFFSVRSGDDRGILLTA